MISPPILTADDLELGYGAQPPLVVGGQLVLGPGQIAALIGANGAGKSTLLRTLAGLQAPRAGTVRIQGRAINQLVPAQLARLRALVLSQAPAPHGLTAAAAVALGRAPHTNWWGNLQPIDHQQIAAAIATTGCQHLADRYLHTLSDGERQKVLLARALAQDTPLVLLDEPTAHLDIGSRVQLLRLLHQTMRATQKAAIIAGHDLDLLLQVADVVWLLPGTGQLAVLDPLAEGQSGSVWSHVGLAADTWEEGQISLLAGLPGQRPVHLAQPHLWPRWALQALRRLGFHPVTGAADTNLRLQATDAGWVLLDDPGVRLQAASLEDLLRQLSLVNLPPQNASPKPK